MGKWIPVGECIPKDFERVLIWWSSREDGNSGYGFGYQVDDVWYGDARGTERKVIAWMPLPPKYEGET